MPPQATVARPVACGFLAARSSTIFARLLAVGGLRHAQRHAVLRSLRSRETRLDRREIELEHVGVLGLAHAVRAPHALRAWRRPRRARSLVGRTAGERRDSDRSPRRSGRSRRCCRTRATCSRSSRDRPAAAPASPSPKNSTNLSTTPFLRSISVTVSTRSVAVAPGRQRAPQPEADDLRDEHRDGLSQHRGFGLDAADAPAEHAEAVHHRRVRVGADQRVGVCALHAVAFLGEDDAREVLEVDLVNDAGVGRHDLEVAEGRLAPAQERIALAVARELDRVVAAAANRRVPYSSTCTEWSITSSAGASGLMSCGLPPRRVIASRIAARSTMAGTPGEVLHDHARRREGNLVARRRLRIPAQQRLDVVARDARRRPRSAAGSRAGSSARRADDRRRVPAMAPRLWIS